MADKKKMGRPTENPKPHMIYARISDSDMQILENYCEKNNITRPEAIRKAIRSLSQN